MYIFLVNMKWKGVNDVVVYVIIFEREEIECYIV